MGQDGVKICAMNGLLMIATSRTLLLKFHSAPVHWNMRWLTKVVSYLTLTVTRMQTQAVSTTRELCIAFVLEHQGQQK
jgi:hypothetical protein